MKTILVSGASGIIGYGILRSLRMNSDAYKLIGTTIYDDSVAPAFCDVFELAPLTTQPEYVDWLCKIIKKYRVDLIIPGINDDMLFWNEHRQRIGETGTKLMLNNANLIDLCADKWKFYRTMCDAGSEYLIESRLSGTFIELKDAFGLPFLLKPRRGFASRGIVVVDSEELFLRHRGELGNVLMAQPIVGDEKAEYTVSAFFNTKSKLCCLMGLRRKLAKEGFTEKAEVAMPPHVHAAVKEMATMLKPIGPTNFQFRVDDGQLKLLEINPRISSATSIRAAFGYNESMMAAQYFLDNIIPTQPDIKRGYAVRYTEDYIFYDSATV